MSSDQGYAPDSSTFQQAAQVLKGYGIWDQTPDSVRQHIEEAAHTGGAAENPKLGTPILKRRMGTCGHQSPGTHGCE